MLRLSLTLVFISLYLPHVTHSINLAKRDQIITNTQRLCTIRPEFSAKFWVVASNNGRPSANSVALQMCQRNGLQWVLPDSINVNDAIQVVQYCASGNAWIPSGNTADCVVFESAGLAFANKKVGCAQNFPVLCYGTIAKPVVEAIEPTVTETVMATATVTQTVAPAAVTQTAC